MVGASANGAVRVDGIAYPMAQHGFARDLPFAVVAQAADSVTLRLEDGPETRPHYPFAFRLDIAARVRPSGLDFTLRVENRDARPLPYAVGFHPAFPWPFPGPFAEGEGRAGGGYAVVFEHPETPRVPEIAPGGLIAAETRPIPMEGARLPLDPDLFKEALVFLDARSRTMRFEAPGGRAIALEAEDFPHLAVWTKPSAPFLSLECWTGHADRAGFSGELSERTSQRLLAPGGSAGHRVSLRLTD